VSDDIHTPTNAGPSEIGEWRPQAAATTGSEATGDLFASGSSTPDGATLGEPPAMAGADLAEGPERPELLVAGAFAGGLVAAMILRRLGG
jgi:hypothetical protein